jgi:hypothetical protein
MAVDLYSSGLEMDPDLNLGSFNLGNVYGIDLSAITENKPSPVVQGDDGNTYLSNAYYTPSGWKIDPDFSTPVYYFSQPHELGEVYENYFTIQEDGSVQQQGAWRTEEDIKAYWDADQGMGYFKEANPNLDYDTWFSFIKDSSDLTSQGFNEYENPEQYNALVNQYGINTSFQNNDGDVFQWNGSSFTKTVKVDDSFDAGGFIMNLAASAMTAGVASLLAPTLSTALGISNTAANSLINGAVQIAKDGEVDLSTAFNLAMPGSGEITSAGQDAIDAVVGEILNPDNYKNVESGGNVEIVWQGHGGTDEIGNPIINLPGVVEPEPTDDGGASASTSPTATTDSTAATTDSASETTTGEFVYDPQHDHVYVGNGVFRQVDENGNYTGVVYTDPDYDPENDLAEIGGMYSVPGSAGDLSTEDEPPSTGSTFGDFYGVLGSIYNPSTTGSTTSTTGTTPSTTTTTTPSTATTTTPTTSTTAPSTTTGTTTTPTPSTTTGTTTTPTPSTTSTTSTTTGTTTETTPTPEPGGNVAGNICIAADGGLGVTDSTGACIAVGTGTGTGQGSGDGSGDGNGDGGDGSGGASIQASRGASYNPFEVQGLSFESVTPTPIQQGNATDFLEGLIKRQSNSLFGKYI